ncbi:ABC-2 type transport system ATP-binding protein [Caldanaerobacter subterraneus subsp. tengcongensis MB4]|uniref:ABC-type multidrug transport system, ATPase component n=1 Tax=Caldanaerobacter subterraneus subsp. tengcongensis (strain DSM 15242 / JCM 11007 / NBRC 100824 / MB4) TaxID=273068 RepID=Q8R875_CALS4|nr:ATP-binding cassette domain-containing protein [Caldanaerobacter subterraneus]AAM25310.1 ABC-type multidrug transport system, ATPase component [Caldanaerobacter subterraneus subsp. tengcongensis MB4]MCS3915090.1 ABC-2 type transport system ATP-binding protein [Caldanaerobacter subterraneus subsp. tengcongensis MB4]
MMVELKNVTKVYGTRKAVDNISFSVDKGEIVGFLGPNGAGKTTTMKMITGYIPPTSGTIKIAGYDIVEQPIEAKKHIGYLPETPPLYLDMTVEAYLHFVGGIKGVPPKKRKEDVEKIMYEMGLMEVRKRLIKNLSRGYKQRVGLAQAIIGDPEVLVLDEPTVGLDPKQIKEIRDIIKKLGGKHTIILSTHILPEVSMVCDRVIIINKGKIVAMDKTENLSIALQNVLRYFIKAEGPYDKVVKTVENIDGVINVEAEIEEDMMVKLTVESSNDRDIRKDVFFAFAKEGLPILELRPLGYSLEEVFLELTTEEESYDEDVRNIKEGA